MQAGQSSKAATSPFYCGQCNVSFSSRKSLIRHRRENQNHVASFNMPGIVLASTYKCDYCDKTCRRLHDLRRHVDEIHRANSRKRRRLDLDPQDSLDSMSTTSGNSSLDGLDEPFNFYSVDGTQPPCTVAPPAAPEQGTAQPFDATSNAVPTLPQSPRLPSNQSVDIYNSAHSSRAITPEIALEQYSMPPFNAPTSAVVTASQSTQLPHNPANMFIDSSHSSRAITPESSEEQYTSMTPFGGPTSAVATIPQLPQTQFISSLTGPTYPSALPPMPQNSLSILLPQRTDSFQDDLRNLFLHDPPNPWLDTTHGLDPSLQASTQLGTEMEHLSAQSINMVNDRDWNYSLTPSAQNAKSHFDPNMTIDVGGGRMTVDENIAFWQDFVEQFPRTSIEITEKMNRVDLGQGKATVEMFLRMGNGEHVVEGYKKSRWELEREQQRWMLVDATTVRGGGVVG